MNIRLWVGRVGIVTDVAAPAVEIYAIQRPVSVPFHRGTAVPARLWVGREGLL